VLIVMVTVKSAKAILMTVTEKEFRKYLARDSHCLHCGLQDETLVPQHRVNRGAGGSKAKRLSNASNIITLCAYFNYLIEASSEAAVTAQAYGWKLKTWQNPLEVTVYDYVSGNWYLLLNDFTRTIGKPPAIS